MASWTIYDSTGTTAKAIAWKIEYTGQYKGDRYLSVTVKSPTPISFAVGDKISYRGDEFVLTVVPAAKRQAADGTHSESVVYEDIRFKSVGIAELQHTQFTDLVLFDNNLHYTALGTFSFYVSKLSDFGSRLLACLNGAYGNGVWTVAYGDGESGGAPLAKDFSFDVSSDTSLWNALVQFSNQSGEAFTVVGRTVTLGSEQPVLGHTFIYGKGNGLKSITRTQDADQRIITRLKAYGSSRNLPYRYYNKKNEVLYVNIVSVSGDTITTSTPADEWQSLFGRTEAAYQVHLSVKIGSKSFVVKPAERTVGDKKYLGLRKLVTAALPSEVFANWTVEDTQESNHVVVMDINRRYTAYTDNWAQWINPDEKMVAMYVPSLMLPGFPEKSLAQWVTETAAGDSEWAEDVQALIDEGFTFSTDKYQPFIYAPTLSEYGQRDGEVIFDGSDEDWEAIYATTSGEEIVTGTNIADNGICSAYTEGDFESGTKDSEGIVMVREFTLVIPDLGFDPMRHLVEGETPMIEVTSGMCQSDHGKFEILSGSISGDTYVLTCKRTYDSAINLFFPNNIYQVAAGDSFILTGITMPDEMVEKASIRLLLQACEWLKQKDFAIPETQVEIDDIYMANHSTIANTLTEGCLFPYQDVSMGIGLTTDTVQQLVIKENDGDLDKEVVIPHYEISLAQDVEATLIDIQTATGGGSTLIFTQGEGGIGVTPVPIVQGTGDSGNSVMSQRAVTQALKDYKDVAVGHLASATLKRTYKFILDDTLVGDDNRYMFVVNYNGETFSTGDITDVTSADDLAYAIRLNRAYDAFSEKARMTVYGGTEDVEAIVDEELVDFEDAEVLTVEFWSGTMSPDLPESVYLYKKRSHVNTLVPLDYPKDNEGTGDKEFYPVGRSTYFLSEKRKSGLLYINIPDDPSEGYTLWTWNGSAYVPLGSNIEIDDEPVEGGENAISSGWAYNTEQKIEGNRIIHNATEDTSGTAAKTSTPYRASVWRVDLSDEVSELYTGLTILFKVPVAGNGTYGTLLRIDGTSSNTDSESNLYPVCANVNSMVSTRYGVGCIVPLTFDADQVGQTLYYNSSSAYTTISDGTGWTKKGCWKIADYDSNTTTTYGTLDYYFRPYTASRLTPYKIVALDKDNRVIPITTEQYCGTYGASTNYVVDDIVLYSNNYYKCITAGKGKTPSTQTSYWEVYTMPSQFTPTATPFRPEKLRYYNSTTLLALGAATGGQTLIEIGYSTSVCSYTFWATIQSYKVIYLQGSYNKATGLFTLDSGSNYYTLVPDNTANLTLSNYFTNGKYYILLGSTYSSNNYFQLFMVNTMYYFDGTNLVPFETKVAKDEADVAKEYANTAHHISIHPQDNVEIAGTVRRYWELYLSNISTLGLPQTFTPTEMGYIGFTSDVISGILSRRYLRISEMYDEEQPIEFPNYKRTYEVVDVRMKLANNEEDYYMYFSLRYEGKYYWDFVGFDDEGEITWTLTTHMLTSPVDSALSSTSENPVQNKVITGALNDISGDVTILEGYFTGGKATNAIEADHATSATAAQSATLAGTATNLASAPTFTVGANGKSIILNVGNQSSQAMTLPYATKAAELENAPSIQAGTTDTKKVTVTAGGKTSSEFTIPFATKAACDDDNVSIKENYLKKAQATFVRYDDVQTLSSGQKGIARQNIDSENIAIGYYYEDGGIWLVTVSSFSSSYSGTIGMYVGSQYIISDTISGTGIIEFLDDTVQVFANNGFTATYMQNSSSTYQIVVRSKVLTFNAPQFSGTPAITFSTSYPPTTSIGFWESYDPSDGSFSDFIQPTARKIYIDLFSNMVYRCDGVDYIPLVSAPFTDAVYSSASESLIFYFGNKTVSVPMGDLVPTFTAGKGIDITGNTIAQNYIVVTQAEMDDYLASGVDDGLIRYVYEDEEQI